MLLRMWSQLLSAAGSNGLPGRKVSGVQLLLLCEVVDLSASCLKLPVMEVVEKSLLLWGTAAGPVWLEAL